MSDSIKGDDFTLKTGTSGATPTQKLDVEIRDGDHVKPGALAALKAAIQQWGHQYKVEVHITGP